MKNNNSYQNLSFLRDTFTETKIPRKEKVAFKNQVIGIQHLPEFPTPFLSAAVGAEDYK